MDVYDELPAQPPPPTEKRCARCGHVKPLDEFVNNKGRPDGKHSWCKPCYAAYAKEKREANPEANREYQREYNKANPARRAKYRRQNHLKSLYGLTVEEFDEMKARQNNRCALCHGEFTVTKTKNSCHVDHDHRTGKVRDLICASCNIALGYMRDDPELMRRAADYIEHHRQP